MRLTPAPSRRIPSRPRALPVLLLLASQAGYAAEPADVAELLRQMRERLTRLENRNAELEKRLAEPRPAAPESAKLAARVEELENEVVALSRKPDPMARFEGVSVGASLTLVGQHANRGVVDDGQLTARADVEVE
ncbi:MAG: hypothetical protein KBG41_03080, partial [Thiobacillaceae bacterium]|nr:hypothetical protein [Thiobacillaceae bacterium]